MFGLMRVAINGPIGALGAIDGGLPMRDLCLWWQDRTLQRRRST
jgi:hypothetical protein